MGAQLEYVDRVFQLWNYTVGMGRLLLRSPKSRGHGTRIDILFQNVKAIKIPTLLEGLSIRSPGPAELQDIASETGITLGAEIQVYMLEGSNYKGYVVAGVFVLEEDLGEYDEPSALLSNLD
jgi:hypothetical protein